MCGEHAINRLGSQPSEGSSPHVRGAHYVRRRGRVFAGIIPACAGSTAYCHHGDIVFGDHPRMCGEHVVCATICARLRGSSPHVRGALFALVVGISLAGIIPACAGSTSASSARSLIRRDHPRMCGEHWLGFVGWFVHLGSSPHVRGAPERDGHRPEQTGIIPACAGSTLRK